MSSVSVDSQTDDSRAEQFLRGLVDLFETEPGEIARFTPIARDAVPEPYRGLLVHEHHMTVTVERYHRTLVDVVVLDRRTDDNLYARKILLTRQSDGVVVQFGLVRLRLELLDDEPRRKILSEGIPLGRVLIEHDVLRVIRLGHLWRVEPGEEMRSHLALEPGETCYGRTAVIDCNGHPAIELLEIVRGLDRPAEG